MRKLFFIIFLFFSVTIIAQPTWTVVTYTNSTTAYGIVTINGNPASVDDWVGAFVGAECRAKLKVLIPGDGKAYINLQIQGESIETVTFKVWDASENKELGVSYTIQSNPGYIIGNPPNYLPINAESKTLNVSPTNQNVPANPTGTTNFVVTSNSSWTVASNQPWCTVTPSGSGNGTIVATYLANTTDSQRNATITIAVSGLTPIVVTVTQEPSCSLSVLPTSLNFTSPVGSNSVSVSSNSSWTVSDDATWITVSPISDSGNGTLTIAVTANTGSLRSGSVNIAGCNTTKTVTVTQSGAVLTLAVSPTSISIESANGSNGTFDITSNTSWGITDDASWLTESPVAGSNNGTITLTASSSNTGSASRSATVTITGTGVSNKTVMVTQNGTECIPVTITIQPQNQSVSAGSTATFSVSVSGVGPFSYYWYKDANLQTSTMDVLSTSNSYTTPALNIGEDSYYYCYIINCNYTYRAESNKAYLTINDTAVSITTQPSNQTVPEGSTATFSVSANGTAPYTYNWYRNGVRIITTYTYDKSNTYITPALSASNNGDNYYCLITNYNGTYQAQSNKAYLTVTSDVEKTVSDIDGNIYNTVTIGTQVWMGQNLKTTKYNDGTSIPMITDINTWGSLSTPAYCWYNNDISNKNPYGALYNWYAVDTKKLCSTGWHVPSNAEWTSLTNYLGGESIAGNRLKESGSNHWLSPNTGATNQSGFTAFPGGGRIKWTDLDMGLTGHWWSSSEVKDYDNVYNASTLDLTYVDGIAHRWDYNDKYIGISVRCLCDVSTSSIDELSNTNKIVLFPNPTKDIVKITLDKSIEGEVRIDVYNNIGLLIQSKNVLFRNNTTQIDLSGYSPGIYLIKIDLNGNSFFGKILKQ